MLFGESKHSKNVRKFDFPNVCTLHYNLQVNFDFIPSYTFPVCAAGDSSFTSLTKISP